MKFDKSTQNFTFVGIGKIIGSGLQAIFYIIFASILNPALFGEMSYYIALAQTTSIISRFGLNHTITIYQAKEKSSLVDEINTLAFITTTVAAIILLPIHWFASLLCLSMSFFVMAQHNMLGKKEFKKYMIISLLQGALHVVMSIIMYLILDIPGILLGMAISNLLCSIPYLKSFSSFKKSFNNLKQIKNNLIHNFGVDISINLSRRIDKLLIFPVLGFSSVGLFQFNTQILFGLELIPLTLHSYLLTEESSGNKHKKLEYYVIAISILISFLLVIFSPLFVQQFFSAYVEGIFSLQVLSLAIIPLSISAIFSAKLQAMESTKVGISALIRIGSLVILIPILGYWFDLLGLSLAVLFSSIFYTIFLIILYKKHQDNVRI